MPIRRKYEHKGWSRTGYQRHKWEDENKIIVIGIGKVSEDKKHLISTHIRRLLDQFRLPVEVKVTVSESYLMNFMEQVIQSSLVQGKIDSASVLKRLNQEREKDIGLRAAIIMKVNASDYRIAKPAGEEKEPEYGIAEEDGLVILRVSCEEAVRHEMGHMLGINSHCQESPNCVMRYECPSKNFCKSCEAKLKGLWCYAEPQ